MSSSVTYFTPALRNGRIHDHDRDSFHSFFDCWIAEQDLHLQELLSASREEHHQHQHQHQQQQQQEVLRALVGRVMKHYEQYYRAKSRWAQDNALSMFKPSWRSSLEDAFLWIGGWRPTMAFHLLYSESGLQFEARLDELMKGIPGGGGLGELSPGQVARVDELQRETVKEEREITEKLAKKQEAVADASMVEMAQAAAPAPTRLKSTLGLKEKGMVEILHGADDLRLRTLNKLLDVLTPMQAVHFLIAAAALHLRVHEWGTKRDAELVAGGDHHY